MEAQELRDRGNTIEEVIAGDFTGKAEAAVYCLSAGDNVTLGYHGDPNTALLSVASIAGWLFYKTNTTDLKPFMTYFFEEVAKAMVRFAADELEADMAAAEQVECQES